MRCSFLGTCTVLFLVISYILSLLNITCFQKLLYLMKMPMKLSSLFFCSGKKKWPFPLCLSHVIVLPTSATEAHHCSPSDVNLITVSMSRCSGRAECTVRQAPAEGVGGMEHQQRPLHRRRHWQDRHGQQPKLEPGYQMRLLRPEQHRLPHHEAVSDRGPEACSASVPRSLCVLLSLTNRRTSTLNPHSLQENLRVGCSWPDTRRTAEPHKLDQSVWPLNFFNLHGMVCQ